MYKHFIKTKVNQFNKNLHDKLRKLKNKKPKEYWNILNPKKKKVDNSIDINSLYNHFKTLNEQTNTEGRNITVDDIPDNGDEILTQVDHHRSSLTSGISVSGCGDTTKHCRWVAPDTYRKNH